MIEGIKSGRVNIFLLFLILAFTILVVTKLSSEYTNTVTLNTIVTNAPDEVVILNDSTHKLNITLTAQGFKWLKYYLNTPDLTIDFANDVSKKDSVYIWSSSKGFQNVNNQFEINTVIKSINPDTLLFKYDVNAVKYLPVKVNAKIEYMLGYNTMEAVSIKPDSVKVIGPASLISKLEFLETNPIELLDVRTSIDAKLPLKIKDLDDNINVTTKTVTVKAAVEKFTEGTVKIPVQIINIPKGKAVKHFPKNISVSYYTSLKAFNTITENDFKVICDYNELKENSSYLIPKLVKQPKLVKSTKLHQQKIEFIITQ